MLRQGKIPQIASECQQDGISRYLPMSSTPMPTLQSTST